MKTEQDPAWRAVAAATPLRSWSGSQLLAYGAGLQSAVQRWGTAWGLDGIGDACVRCAAAAVADGHAWSWQVIGSRASAAAWMAQADDLHGWIAQQLFEADGADTPVLKAVCQACVRDLGSHLARALEFDEAWSAHQPPGAAQLGPWCGAVIATLPVPAIVLATGSGVAACIGAPACGTSQARRAASGAQLMRIDEALSSCAIPLRATLQPCELDIATLERLQPGDVVRLPHALDRPLDIETAPGCAAFVGALVRTRGAKAVELVACGSPR